MSQVFVSPNIHRYCCQFGGGKDKRKERNVSGKAGFVHQDPYNLTDLLPKHKFRVSITAGAI
jgi:hypothetical protein